MIVYYMMFGVISIVALAVNVLFLVALLSMLQATLTLPGMAGIALTVGMAIDANVLINERIREELRNGNTPQAAIHAGYERAWGTILDSNVTTLIAGIALFCLRLRARSRALPWCCVSAFCTSIFSAVMVSRALVNLLLRQPPPAGQRLDRPGVEVRARKKRERQDESAASRKPLSTVHRHIDDSRNLTWNFSE